MMIGFGICILLLCKLEELRGDLIEAFKMLKGFDDSDSNKYFVLSEAQTSGHPLKLFHTGHNVDCPKLVLFKRIA